MCKGQAEGKGKVK